MRDRRCRQFAAGEDTPGDSEIFARQRQGCPVAVCLAPAVMRRAWPYSNKFTCQRVQTAVTICRLVPVGEEENRSALRTHHGMGNHRKIHTTALYPELGQFDSFQLCVKIALRG